MRGSCVDVVVVVVDVVWMLLNGRIYFCLVFASSPSSFTETRDPLAAGTNLI